MRPNICIEVKQDRKVDSHNCFDCGSGPRTQIAIASPPAPGPATEPYIYIYIYICMCFRGGGAIGAPPPLPPPGTTTIDDLWLIKMAGCGHIRDSDKWTMVYPTQRYSDKTVKRSKKMNSVRTNHNLEKWILCFVCSCCNTGPVIKYTMKKNLTLHYPVLKVRFGPPTADFWSVWSSRKACKFWQIQPTT